MTTSLFNLKTSRFRCDNGREYISKRLKEEFESKGIQVEYTIRYISKQNGVAEKINRNIIEKVRCLLLESGMKKIFWSEAVMCDVYIINR